MFVVVVNIISNNWEPKDVTIDLFEAFDIIETIMAFQLLFSFSQKFMVYLKDKGVNLQTILVIFHPKRVIHVPLDTNVTKINSSPMDILRSIKGILKGIGEILGCISV